MSDRVEQFPFVEGVPELGAASLVPLLPITVLASRSATAMGLLDTGATINVLPYSVGLRSGFDWDAQTTLVELSGNLAHTEARAVLVSAVIGGFAPVRLAFAWARTDNVPLLLGQVNFFMEFEVCFFRARRLFEVRRTRKI